MPTVTHDTAAEGAERPVAPEGVASDPAARVRRLVAAVPDPADRSAADLVTAALARFDAPPDLRVRGCLGSGRRTLAAALRARRGWRVTIDDIDSVAVAGAVAAPTTPPLTAPDVEIVCLRTAPCRHEEAWIRRPRRHPLLVVATGLDVSGAWARDLHAVDAREPGHRSVDPVVAFVERALDSVPALRTARLEAELERLAVHPGAGELAEAALCALEI